MKHWFKLLVALVALFISCAHAQSGGNQNQQNSQQSSAFQSVEAAIKAIEDSVPNNDKSATLALLAKACKQYPESADQFVASLIKAISKMNANSPEISASNIAVGGNAGDVNPALVGEIVATAINAAPGSQAAIISAALLNAPNAASQIDAASNNPLTFFSTSGLGGNQFNPASINRKPKPTS